MVLVFFIIFWITIIGLIVIIALSIHKTKREIKIYKDELRKISRSEADKFVNDFKTRITITDGIEKELKERYNKKNNQNEINSKRNNQTN